MEIKALFKKINTLAILLTLPHKCDEHHICGAPKKTIFITRGKLNQRDFKNKNLNLTLLRKFYIGVLW